MIVLEDFVYQRVSGLGMEVKQTLAHSRNPAVDSQQKDNYSREGKDHRCCLGDIIDTISCRASNYTLERFEE